MKILGVLLRIETLKTVKRRALWVAVGVFAAINTNIAVSNVRSAQLSPSFSHALPESWPNVLSGLTSPAGFFIAVLMILLVAPEFSWRTGRQNVIDGLSKERLYAGKVMLLTGLIVLFVGTALLIGVGGTLFSPSEGGPGIIRSTDFSYLGGLTLNLLFFGSAGLMLSTLIRSAGPAMGVLFLYFLVEGVIVGLIMRAGETARSLTEYFPANISEDLGDDLAHYPELLASVNADRAGRGLAPREFLDVEVMVMAVLAYSTIFLLISFLSMRKRDL
ncbi:MAG: hypothetical protein OXF01_13955 [Gemmatimonadetes bacterium]|nr:hypothetical protein [Gemmatimonadota bacterium]